MSQAAASLAGIVVEDLAGRSVRLNFLEGERKALFLWATWTPERDQLDVWAEAWERRGPFPFAAVAVDVRGPSHVRHFLRGRSFPFPLWVDAENRLGTATGLRMIPALLFIGSGGRLLDVRVPAPDARSPEGAEAVLAFVRRQRPPSPPSPPPAIPDTAVHFQLARHFLAQGDPDMAMDALRSALLADPANAIARQQIWMLEHPDRFYPDLDRHWLSERLQQGDGARH